MKCDCCGENVEYYMRGCELMSPYRIHSILRQCQACAKGSNSIIHYWGKKKPEDLLRLRDYLNTSLMIKNKYSAQMNAGYF